MNSLPFIIVSILVIIYIIASIRKGELSIQSSFFWIIFCIAMIILSIFPYSIDWFAGLIGVSYPPALLSLGGIVLLFIVVFKQNKKIDGLEKRINTLSQEISILKSKKNDK